MNEAKSENLGMTRKAMKLATLLCVAGVLIWVSSAPAQERRDGSREGAVKQSAERGDATPGPEAQIKVRDRDGGAQREDGMLGRQPGRPSGAGQILTAAVTASWASENAEVRQLVDKVLADQKAAHAAQTGQYEALSAFVLAARGTDTEALAAARKTLDEAVRASADSDRALSEDLRALSAKLQEISPNRDRRAAPKTGALDGSTEAKAASQEGAQESGARVRDSSAAPKTGPRDGDAKTKSGARDGAPRSGAREGG